MHVNMLNNRKPKAKYWIENKLPMSVHIDLMKSKQSLSAVSLFHMSDLW